MEIRLARFKIHESNEAVAFINDPEGTWVLAVDAMELVKYIRRLERQLRDCHEPKEVPDATSD